MPGSTAAGTLAATLNRYQEGSSAGWPVPLLGGVRGGFLADSFAEVDRAVLTGLVNRTSAHSVFLQPVRPAASPPGNVRRTSRAIGREPDPGAPAPAGWRLGRAPGC